MSRSYGGPEVGPRQTPRGFTGSWVNVPEGGILAALNPAKRADSLGEFEGAYLVTRKEIDPVQLQEDLVRRLGEDVTVTLRMPSDTEPGYLRVQDVRNGVDLDIDPAVLDEVVERNSPPESSGQRFLREFDTAATQAAQLLALRDYIARDVAEQEHRNGDQRRMHVRIARAFEARVATERMLNPVTGQPIRVQAL
jgi:hypothetical protein